MKTEIAKIVEMNKSGKISDEQMVELIAALKEGDATEEKSSTENDRSTSPGETDWATAMGEDFHKRAHEEVTKAMGAMGGLDGIMSGVDKVVQGVTKSLNMSEDAANNSSTMSKVDITANPNIKNNSFNLSKVRNFRVDESSAFVDNSVNAANAANFEILDHSQILECSFNASNADNIRLRNSIWSGLDLNAAKMKNVELENSKIEGCSFNAAKFVNCRFENCSFEGIDFNRMKMSDVTLRGVHLSGEELSLRSLVGVELNSTEEFLAAAKIRH